jgi:hypothetical protein
MAMNKNDSNDLKQTPPSPATISWVLGPGECMAPGWPPYPYYQCQPPYCTPSVNLTFRSITQVTFREEQVAFDHQVTAVNRWAEQVLRKELGGALVKAEKDAKRRLAISLSVESAELITQALKLKASAQYERPAS